MLTVGTFGTSSVQAVTYLWDGGGADNNWSSTTNWNPDTSSPTSASNTVVQLDGDLRTTSQQDLSSPFVLNKLDFTGAWSAFTLNGAPLQFVADGATPPRITHPRTSSVVINNAINIPTGTTLNLQLDTQTTTFNGAITGGGSIDRLLAWNGTLNLNNGDNSFSGGLTVRSQNKEYYIVKINASNAMGTGPVSLYGGTLSTNVVFPSVFRACRFDLLPGLWLQVFLSPQVLPGRRRSACGRAINKRFILVSTFSIPINGIPFPEAWGSKPASRRTPPSSLSASRG